MSERLPPQNSLVLYKGRPARVKNAGDKLEIELEGGETQPESALSVKVRPKDVTLLHPGPLKSLAELRPQPGDASTAWEMLAGGVTTLADLAELIYGAFTPATAWATWQLVTDGLYFRGSAPDAIIACTPEEVSRMQAGRAADTAEKKAWHAFLGRVKAGHVAGDDDRYVREIAALALGRSSRSRVLRDLDREETPEVAHQTLLDLGAWTSFVNPYPARVGVTTAQPALPVPSLPDEPRRDLTYLPAFAIDNAWTETPDDALSLEANRLWVHVADPAAIAPPNSPLDLEARGRGASLYLPEDTIHMLPAAATPLLGLGLAPVSPALSFGIDLAAGCEIAAVEIVPSWVRVTRLTYEEVAGRLTEEPFAQLYRLALAYQARRVANGAFTLNLPEVNVRVTRSGADPPPLPPSLAELALSLSKGKGEKYTPLLEGEGPGERSAWRVLLRPVPPLPSQTLVENAMILAGEAVARFALEHGIPLPFATQEPADSDERGDSFAKLPAGGSLAAAFAFRRRLKRSQYRGAAAPHSGLGLAAYTQVTSPLRRYLDLVAHQQLRAYLTGAPLLDTGQIVERAGATEAVIGGIRQAEQFSNQHWTLVYLLQNPKWRGEGVVVERRERNSVVLIPELGLEPSIYLPADPPLDSTVRLTVTHVDLPRLDVRFRVSG